MQDLEKLRDEMNRQHIKAFSLAKKANINSSDLYQVLKGDRPLYPGWRKRIAEALDVPEAYLFDERNNVNEQ